MKKKAKRRLLVGLIVTAQILVQMPVVYATESDEVNEIEAQNEGEDDIENVDDEGSGGEDNTVNGGEEGSDGADDIVNGGDEGSDGENIIGTDNLENVTVTSSPIPDTTTGTGDANPEASLLPTENAGEIFYTVKFVDSITEEEIASVPVKSGESAEAPTEVPTHEGYEFKGWDAEAKDVTGDMTVKALYEAVVIEDEEDNEVQSPEYSEESSGVSLSADAGVIPEGTSLSVSSLGDTK